MAKPTKRKAPTIKETIRDYMDHNDYGYQEMTDKMGLAHVQSFYRWMKNPNENYSSEVERKFNELVVVDELS